MQRSSKPFVNLTQEPIYKKALEINGLVKNVVHHLTIARSTFDRRNSQFDSERCLDALQLTALRLPLSLAELRVTMDYRKKLYFQEHILRITEDLEQYCFFIRKRYHKNKNVIKLLRALKDFHALHTKEARVVLSQN